METSYARALWTMIVGGKQPHAAVTAMKKNLEARGRSALLPKIARAFARRLERLEGFIDPRRPLHGQAPVGIAGMGVLVRMHLGLNCAKTVLEAFQIERLRTRQAEQGEMISSEIQVECGHRTSIRY